MHTEHPDLSSEGLQILGAPSPPGSESSFSRSHGTFVAGILKARRGSRAPALCPDCTLVVRPIFGDGPDGDVPSAGPEDLAQAIADCLDAGARIVNLSSVLMHASDAGGRMVRAALDEAARHGVLVVAAAGNQGVIGGSEITAHPCVIPVAAYDARGVPMPGSNLGASIGSTGVGAPGQGIVSLGTPDGAATASGTSVAAPFVTGALALFGSLFPQASSAQLRAALLMRRRGAALSIVPPLLDGRLAYRYLSSVFQERSSTALSPVPSRVSGILVPATAPTIASGAIVPSQDTPPPDAGAPDGGEGAPSAPQQTSFVYAIGRIEMQFRDTSTERELVQTMGRSALNGQTDTQALHSVLTDPDNGYLARQLCYILTIEGIETYLLMPEVSQDYPRLLAAIRPTPSPDDIDVVVGVLGPLAPPELCGGRQLPIVQFSNLYSFRQEELINAMPRARGAKKEEFEVSAQELFGRVIQIADNAGTLDEHRAVNYLSVRYPRLYEQTAAAFQDNQSLTAIEARPSRLSGTERIVTVILTFTDRQTAVNTKYFVRVNVTGMFPFLVSELQPYYER